jgi:hypothetical protein
MNRRTDKDDLWEVVLARDLSIRELRAHIDELREMMEQKERVIHQLKKTCDERDRLLRNGSVRGLQRLYGRRPGGDRRSAIDQLPANTSSLKNGCVLPSAPKHSENMSADDAALLKSLALRIAQLDAVHVHDVVQIDQKDRQISEKEQVINQLKRALQGYRAAFFFVRPLMPAIRAIRNVRRLLMPKLGSLIHHPPIPLVLPKIPSLTPSREWPSISIVTPSFRQGEFIERTIKSVLEQRYPKLNYFVQDGGSTDETIEVLRRYGPQLAGWSSGPDAGQSQAINLGFAKTTGEIMAWLNSDDLLMPGALAHVASYFAEHPEIDVVYGHRILIDVEDREIGRWVLPPHSDEVLSWADFVPQETLFWRRNLWDKVGGVDESFRFAMDWDLLLRFREAGARMVRLPHFLGAFRIHEAQKTSAVINEVGQIEMNRLRKRVLGRDVDWLEIRTAITPYLIRHLSHDLLFRVRSRLGRVC